MDLFLKLVLSIIFVAAFVTLNFTVFKIPIKGNDKQIALLALVVGGVNFYFKFVVESPYFILIQTITYIILLAAFRRYPLLYSLLVCTIGSAIGALLDAFVSFGAVSLKLSTIDLMKNDLSHYIVFHMISTIVYFAVAFALVKFKIGFSFIYHKFYVIEKFNLIWMVLLVLLTSFLTFGSVRLELFSIQSFMLIIITIALLISLFYGYKQNKISLSDRYQGGAIEKGGRHIDND
jgi:hypothetical protein